MPHIPYLYEFSPLYLAQAALTIWMLVDASRRGVDTYWFWIILFFQPLGTWAYFFIYKVRDFTQGSGWLGSLFARRVSLEELRYRVEQSPTTAARLELAEQLVVSGEYEEAEPHLKAVLAREPEHGTALFALAECHRQLNRPVEAVPLLQKLITQHPGWRRYRAWYSLIETHETAGEYAEAVAQARKLSQVAPSLQHTCMLANSLARSGDRLEARRVVEKGLEDYRFNRYPSPDDRRWVSKAKRLLTELE